VDVIKEEGRFKSSQSIQQYNLNLTMQLDEEMKRVPKEGWENVGPIIIYTDKINNSERHNNGSKW
jgi:hypothetical protein